MKRGAIRRWWSWAAIAVAAACASIAPATAPEKDQWVADPDAQFSLSVQIHNLTIGDGVRAYQTPEGACVLLGDFSNTLSFPIKTDFAAATATGWAFNEKNSIAIDRKARTASISGKRESFAITDIRDTPDGWCVDSKALGKWFGMGVNADVFNSLLRLQSDRRLPAEEALIRVKRGDALAAKKKNAQSLKDLPQVRMPYRLWRAPAFEFVVNAGVRYGGGKVSVGRDASVYAAGEVAGLSYSANIGISQNGLPKNVWARFYRSDPEASLLGPLKATHVAFGDVPGLSSTLRSAGGNGRGLVITNRPLLQTGSVDRTEFRGRLPDGWDAELYRNGSLVAFDNDPAGSGEYVFKDIEILAGDNAYEVVLHGPQGQTRTDTDHINVSRNAAPPGKLWYWAGVRQEGEKLLDIQRLTGKLAAQDTGLADGAATRKSRFGVPPEAALQLQYGISRTIAVSALVRSVIEGDERVTYAEGSVRKSIGASVIDVAASIDSAHRLAARAQLLAKLGAATLSASSTFGSDPTGEDFDGKSVTLAHRIGLAFPVKLGGANIPISTSVGKRTLAGGGEVLDGTLRLGARIGRFNLANSTTFQKVIEHSNGASSSTQSLVNELIGTGRVGKVRVRGSIVTDVVPEARLRTLGLNAYWAQDEKREWDAGVQYDALSKVGMASLSHIRRFDGMSAALIGEAQTNGNVGVKLRLNFSLDPFRRGLRPTRERLASTGLVQARVFEDLNENGRFDDGEPVAQNAAITTGTKQSEALTGGDGLVTVGGLTPFVPTPVGIDQTSLANPALTPLKPAQVIVPRPGVAALVDIALVGGGSIEAFAARSDGSPYEGLDFELVEADGTVIATTRSDLDGYIVFENIHYGNFTIRLAKASAEAIRGSLTTPVNAAINRDRPALRIGAITVASLK